ncbi:MAG TPA: GNAT family N-acetyltransferase [Solirubrobacteraceae bacterium]|jgi:GNAT superfamily N-acetyltransferase|nr:GNAT family N-acetyltransferase [Solirubrobacteraceae bacterium]
MAKVLAFREIAHDDIDELAALVADAFVGYRDFAPAGWQPPSAGEQARGLQDWIADPGSWGELASEGQTLVGHATFIPAARHSFRAAPDLSLAHLGHLFVKPPYWGSGVARQLLDHATSAAAARGFRVMRLFVPAGQARARRFYAREGFVAVGEPFEFGLGLPVLEYRRSLELQAQTATAGVASRSAAP